jgi:DMSO/TMAO reductase YedYZ molybdopterin-dependent catalytic subunit
VRAFLVWGIFLIGAFFGIRYLYHRPSQKGDRVIPGPLRASLNVNEKIFSGVFDSSKMAKTYPVSAAVKKVRVNGMVGLMSKLDTSDWKLKVLRAPGDTLFITLGEIKRLPKTDIVFDFKCIEGWNQVTHWGGVRVIDFLRAYHLERMSAHKYLGLQTPDGEYYVGIDMPSAIHPQTLLCYEMNGASLPDNQGAPLRLIIPLKYGIKHLKRIGLIYFSDTPPRDYWAERGYDYYAGH